MVGTESPSLSGYLWERKVEGLGESKGGVMTAAVMREVFKMELTQTLVFLEIGRNLLVEEEHHI